MTFEKWFEDLKKQLEHDPKSIQEAILIELEILQKVAEDRNQLIETLIDNVDRITVLTEDYDKLIIERLQKIKEMQDGNST